MARGYDVVEGVLVIVIFVIGGGGAHAPPPAKQGLKLTLSWQYSAAQNLLLSSPYANISLSMAIYPMVLILDGNSYYFAHAYRQIGLSGKKSNFLNFFVILCYNVVFQC